MVYHSVPDPNKTYPDHMTNFELTKFEISKVFYTDNGTMVDYVEATVTTFFPREMDLTRPEVIGFMKQQGSGFYYKGNKLTLELVNNNPYIHFVKSSEPRDILK